MAKRKREVRISGTPRREIDVDLMTQAVIALGRELWAQQQAKPQKNMATDKRVNS